ncbi:MAG: glycosyltransferase [Anaerolineae bacterium]
MPEDRLNILHLILNLKIGGAQEVVRALVKSQGEQGCRPLVCTFEDGPMRQAIEEQGIKVYIAPPRRHSIVSLPFFLMDMLRIRKALTQLIRKYEIDIIQTHLLGTLNFLALTLPFNSSHMLWTFHGVKFLPANQPKLSWWLRAKNRAHRLLYRGVRRWVGDLVAVSDDTKASVMQLTGLGDKDVVIIPNGVDVARFEGITTCESVREQLGFGKEAILVITVATLLPPKGHCHLIAAAPAVLEQYPNAHFLFIGDGVLRPRLEQQVDDLNLRNNIHFLGSRNDIPQLLAAGDLFVLPSEWEGLPIALLEAMVAGKPIVATDLTGVKLAMIHGETGLIVPPKNPERLAEAIVHLISCPDEAQAMGQAAKLRAAREFSIQKQAGDYIALYRRLLNHTVSKA